MPVSHSVLENGSLVVCRAEGAIDDAALMSYLRELERGGCVLPEHRAFVDFSGTVDCSVTSQAVRGAANLFERNRVEGADPRVALLVPTDVGFGLGRMFASLVGHLMGTVAVFREAEQARRWLDALPGDVAV